MNNALQYRLSCLNTYIRDLCPKVLGMDSPVSGIKVAKVLHGDHNLVAKLEIRDNQGRTITRCMKVDISESMWFKKREFCILSLLKGRGIAPQVFGILDSPPRIITHWIHGEKPVPVPGSTERKPFIRSCAALYNRLHGIAVPKKLYKKKEFEYAGDTPEKRYNDFMKTLISAANGFSFSSPVLAERFSLLKEQHRKKHFPYQETTAPRPSFSPSPPVVVHLSPKTGNLAMTGNTPVFLDWDSARFSDKERDIAVFIGLVLRTKEEVSLFCSQLTAFDPELAGRYLVPVMLWREMRSGYPLPLGILDFLDDLRVPYVMITG